MSDREAEGPVTTQLPERPAGPHTRPADAMLDASAYDIVQKTCAMYVAVRSSALEVPVAFGRDLEEVTVHWNMCPGGTMVACAAAPAANGDTMRTGIPWPY